MKIQDNNYIYIFDNCLFTEHYFNLIYNYFLFNKKKIKIFVPFIFMCETSLTNKNKNFKSLCNEILNVRFNNAEILMDDYFEQGENINNKYVEILVKFGGYIDNEKIVLINYNKLTNIDEDNLNLFSNEIDNLINYTKFVKNNYNTFYNFIFDGEKINNVINNFEYVKNNIKKILNIKNTNNVKYQLFDNIIRLSISFKEARDTNYINEIKQMVGVNGLFITTDEIINIRCSLNNINSINVCRGLPRYIYICNGKIINMYKFNVFYNFLVNDELNQIDKNKYNIDKIFNEFKPHISKKYIIKNQNGGDVLFKEKKYIGNIMVCNKKKVDIEKDIVNKIHDLTVNLDLYLENEDNNKQFEDNITMIFIEIKKISEQISWKNLIKFNFNEKFKCSPDIFLYYFELFDKFKLKYENYFKTNLDIGGASNYHFLCAIVIFLTFSNIGSIDACYKINKIIPMFINNDIINILTIVNCDKIIWNDKIKKGIIVEIKYKDDQGEIVKIIYEEHPEMYDFYYNKLL